MYTLTVTADLDTRDDPVPIAGQQIATINFTAAAVLTIFSSSFNGTDVSANVTLNGSGGVDQVYVVTDGPVFSAEEWSFGTWDSDDLITIEGSAQVNTLTGSSQRDLFLLASHDTANGGAGDDIFRVFGASGTFNLAVDGGTETTADRFQVVGAVDLRTITIANVEGLEDISGATTAQLGSDQVGAGKINIFNSSQPTALALQVFGATADLSTATFGTWGAEDSVALFGTAGVDTLKGSSKRDTLLGGASNDTLFGNDGNDILTGGAGRDTMTGGTGLDDFDFNKVAEIGKTSSTRDKIIGFTHLQDDIDLSTIDANGSASGDKAFTFLATKDSVFTGIRGQVRWFQINTSGTTNDKTIIEGDVNGDEKADFQIELVGLKTLTKADFIL
ncbi:MAG: hypothetical protein U1E49_20555 [Hyphomicrobiaceae bacterium]